MKNLLIGLLTVLSLTLNAQLNEYARAIKVNDSEAFNLLIENAKEKYPDSYKMQLFEINTQAESMAEVLSLFIENKGSEKTFSILIRTWSKEGEYDNNLKVIESGNLCRMNVNWRMIEFNYRQELKAKNELIYDL